MDLKTGATSVSLKQCIIDTQRGGGGGGDGGVFVASV